MSKRDASTNSTLCEPDFGFLLNNTIPEIYQLAASLMRSAVMETGVYASVVFDRLLQYPAILLSFKLSKLQYIQSHAISKGLEPNLEL